MTTIGASVQKLSLKMLLSEVKVLITFLMYKVSQKSAIVTKAPFCKILNNFGKLTGYMNKAQCVEKVTSIAV